MKKKATVKKDAKRVVSAGAKRTKKPAESLTLGDAMQSHPREESEAPAPAPLRAPPVVPSARGLPAYGTVQIPVRWDVRLIHRVDALLAKKLEGYTWPRPTRTSVLVDAVLAGLEVLEREAGETKPRKAGAK